MASSFGYIYNQKRGDLGIFNGVEWVPTSLASGVPASLVNLSVSGWERVGSLVVPTNVTAGDFTAERIWVPDQASSTLTGLINGYSNGVTVVPFVARMDSGSGGVGYRIQGAGTPPFFEAVRSGGTIASPSAVVNTNNLFSLRAQGFYDTTNLSGTQGSMRWFANENWSATNLGTSFALGVTAAGGTAISEPFTLTASGLAITGTISATTTINATTGYRVNGAAASGNVLRGDGTNFVSSTLAGTDVVAGFTGYTPTVTQGGTVTSFSTNTARYSQVGKTVNLNGVLIINNAGTAAGANDVSVSLPVNFAFPSSVPGMGGTAQIYDASADILYPAAIRITSATTFKFVPVDQVATAYGAGGLYLGTLRFTAALATSDQIVFNLTYEAT